MKPPQRFTATLLLAVPAKIPTQDPATSLPLLRSSLKYLKKIWRSLEDPKKKKKILLHVLFLLKTGHLHTSSIKIPLWHSENSDG